MIPTKEDIKEYIDCYIQERERIASKMNNCDKRTLNYRYWVYQYKYINGFISGLAQVLHLYDIDVERFEYSEDDDCEIK